MNISNDVMNDEVDQAFAAIEVLISNLAYLQDRAWEHGHGSRWAEERNVLRAEMERLLKMLEKALD